MHTTRVQKIIGFWFIVIPMVGIVLMAIVDKIGG